MVRKTATNRKNLNQTLFDQRERVERFLALRVRNIDDARELAQEAFLRLLRVKNEEFIERPDAYLFRIAINLFYEYRLKEKRYNFESYSDVEVYSEMQNLPQSAEEIASQQQRMATIETALQDLAPNVRAALILHRREGYTYCEIAERLGVSTSMVKKYLQRALIRCRACTATGSGHED